MAKIPSNPFVLVDGSSYLFRAYHALPPLTTKTGQPTGAIFGVINMLKKLITEFSPSNMVVVFDSKEKNFRHALYEPYKANRTIMPDELQLQIEPLQATIKALGLPLVVIPGIEADDIIGTLAKIANDHGLFTLISTGDKDFAQLVDEKTLLVNTMSGDIFDRNKIIEKFEVPPEQIVDYLTLIGDTVDNVPGVPKVGPKTAVKWLQEYGNLDNIVARSADIPGKVGENLRASLDNLPLFRKLVTIQVKLPLEIKPEDFVVQKPNNEMLRELFTQLEFKNWLKELDKNNQAVELIKSESIAIGASLPIDHGPSKSTVEYETILTKEQFEKWFNLLQKVNTFAFDIQTTSFDYMLAKIVGLSVAIKPRNAVYIPFGHDYLDAPVQLSQKWVLEKMRPLLESENYQKIGHNLKNDIEVLLNEGIVLKGVAFDIMLESYVLDSTASRHDIDTLADRYLNYKTVSFEEVAGKGAKQITFNQVPVEQAAFYAAENADITLQLHQNRWPLLESLPRQMKILQTVEIPLVPVLARMEHAGVLIDTNLLEKQSQELGVRLLELEKGCYLLAGESFNINSPKQLQEVLYTRLHLPILEKTPTGQPSTAESVLQELALNFPLPKIILEYRSLSKLKSTYTDKLPQQVNPKTGRIHTSYHQAVTATGRLSSSDPNLQNIPIRSQEGRKIRSAFIAAPGYKIVAADYSQIELRIMAHLSQDPELLRAFSADDDIHRSTAAAIFGVKLDDVTSDMRRNAKAINFGLMYGMSAFGVAKQLGIERSEAEKQMQRYFTSFPGVKTFMEETRQKAVEQGYIETVLGRRLYLPDLKSRQMGQRRAAERAAINAPMQGTNADIIKLSMIRLDAWIQANTVDARMIMQVHDELVFEVSESILDKTVEQIKLIMETALPLSVQLKVGIGVGNNWDEAH